MKKFLTVLALVLVFAPPAAQADPVTVNGMGTYYTTGGIHTPTGSPFGHISGDFSIGQAAITWNGQTYVGYYIEPFNDFDPGDPWMATQRMMSQLPAGGPDGRAFNSPYTVANAGVHAAWIANTYGPTVASGDDAAALQLALWLTIYPGLKTSWFEFRSHTYDIRTQAWRWYNEGANQTSDAIWLDAQHEDRSLDVVIPQAVRESASVVPEPASMVLLGTGMLGLAGVLRRRLDKKR